MPCHDEGMSSRATQGYWKLGAIGCRGASWSEQLDDKELRGALGRVIEAEIFLVFWTASSAHASSSATVWYVYFKGLCKLCCSAVMKKSKTSYSSVFSHVLCVRAIGYSRVAFPILEASDVCSVRAVFENSHICGSCLIGECLLSR